MAGLFGDDYDDEPRGLLGGLSRGMTNPLFLAGAGLLSGEGFGGAMQGLRMGAAFQDQRLQQAEQMRKRQQFDGLIGQINAPPDVLALARMQGPDRGAQMLGSWVGPWQEAQRLDLEMKRAQIRKMDRETAEAGSTYGKTGTTVRGPDGKFYVVRYGADGTERINPLQLPGAPANAPMEPTGSVPQDGAGRFAAPGLTEQPRQQAPIPLTPDRGIKVVGRALIDGATGDKRRDVGKELERGKFHESRGQDIAKTAADLPEAQLRLQMVTGNLDRLEKTAQDLAKMPGLDRVVGGLYQAYAPNVSQDAIDADTELENLKVKISGVVLQSMRDMSKTGGAIGQVTEREWPRLENMLANLNPKQGRERFLANLGEVVSYTQNVKRQLQAAYDADVAKVQGFMQSPTQSATSAPTGARPDPLGLFGGD